MPNRVRGAAPLVSRPQVSCRLAVGSDGTARARHFGDVEVRRRREFIAPRAVQPHAASAPIRAPLAPSARAKSPKNPFERIVLRISLVLLPVTLLCWCWLVNIQFSPSSLVTPASAKAYVAATEVSHGDKFGAGGVSSYARTAPQASALAVNSAAGDPLSDGGDTPAGIVAREWSIFEQARWADALQVPPTQPAQDPPLHFAAAPAHFAPVHVVEPVRLAALEGASPQLTAPRAAPDAVAPRSLVNINAKTSLVDFQTAPFPYHGNVPGTDRPFLNAGEAGHRGHASFRGHVFWEGETFSDDRVLLHIPPGFDPTRPAVMIVYFHGHGANLARDVRDRQRLPDQITEGGVNAVLVAPQFAVNAADSSAGKFWEPNGFKRFLDEAAVKLAGLYGDQRSAAAFANMPIVIVAYSGGFGPTLSVLDRGGVRSRVHGLVLLDALYAGMDKFAEWIASNRSAFFISSYTPHTAGRNAYLERLLRDRSVPYDSELKASHLKGMVAFLPAGNVSHRDFVTHAWADDPVSDFLARMDDIDSTVGTSAITASIPSRQTTKN